MNPSANPRNSFTVSSHCALVEPIVSAYLYNPPVEEIRLVYPYKTDVEVERLEPVLTFQGSGFVDGRGFLVYRIRAGDEVMHQGETEVEIAEGWFDAGIELEETFPRAEGVVWELSGEGLPTVKGDAPLAWSRFHGRVEYLDGGWRSTGIDLRPITWGVPGSFTVPVADDGRFDALVPARVYAVANVNGTGYGYDALERWGWDYDLTRDREDLFTIGRTELYGMRAFGINGGQPVLFVIFRPTALSRVLRFDDDGDGLVRGEERDRQHAAMRHSPTVIGPELKAGDVRVWFDGEEREIEQFDAIPEYSPDIWQIQYLLQIYLDPQPARGVWHEVRVEVRSRETLRGEEIVDFGQGSIGFFRP